MTDLEKVINGLECCNSLHNDSIVKCATDCPYWEFDAKCRGFVMRDALALLKAQEPRVMTLGEVLENAGEIGFPCWVEDHNEDIGGVFLFPAVVTSDDTYVEYIGNTCYEGAIYHWAYNKRLRCWTSRPDEKRRAETPWRS